MLWEIRININILSLPTQRNIAASSANQFLVNMLNKDTETSKVGVVAYGDSPLLFEAANTLIFFLQQRPKSPKTRKAFFSTIVLVIPQHLVA